MHFTSVKSWRRGWNQNPMVLVLFEKRVGFLGMLTSNGTRSPSRRFGGGQTKRPPCGVKKDRLGLLGGFWSQIGSEYSPVVSYWNGKSECISHPAISFFAGESALSWRFESFCMFIPKLCEMKCIWLTAVMRLMKKILHHQGTFKVVNCFPSTCSNHVQM